MGWLKISDENGGVYAREPDPEPAEIVTINELQERLAYLNSQVKTGTPEEIAAFWNAYHGNSRYQDEIRRILETIDELKQIV